MRFSPRFLQVGGYLVSEPSKDIQNIVETICPQLCRGKLILQEIIWALTPGRCCKGMTQALADRAAKATGAISRLLEGVEETPQLLENILQLERTLRDVYLFVQSETQRNVLFRMLFAEDLQLRYLSLDRQLIELPTLFEQTAKKAPVLCTESLSPTHQESLCGVEGALAEIVLGNNSSDIVHASASLFHRANGTILNGGTFYAGHNLFIQNHNRTPKGIVEGTDVFTVEDVPPEQEIYIGRGYRIYSAYSTAKARAVKIKMYERHRANERCLAAAEFNQKVMHPSALHLIGVSPLNSKIPFLVFDADTEWAVESVIASALRKGLKQGLHLGIQTVAGLSSGLDYLRTLEYPFASVGLDHFIVNRNSRNGNILISFDPEILLDEPHEHDQSSDTSDKRSEVDIFHGLCQKTFDAACKAHYEFQKFQRTYVDELDTMDQDRFEEVELDTGPLPPSQSNDATSNVFSSVPSNPPLPATPSTAPTSQRSPRKPTPTADRRELVWKSQNHEAVSLEDMARQFQDFMHTPFTEFALNRRRGRYTTKTAHRCPGYSRIEITLTTDLARSAIVSHLTPTPHEICPVCKEIVKDAETFACICGADDIESIPTIRCSTCLEWHHRPCVNAFESEDRTFICHRCSDLTLDDHPPEVYSIQSNTTSSPKSPFDPLSGGARKPPPYSGNGFTPLHGSTAQSPNLIGRFKNWRGILKDAPNLSSRGQPCSLNKGHYESVITLTPKGRSYPLYNLDAKLGKRDGHNSIEFLCSASPSTGTSFRQIVLEIELFQLGNVNSEYHSKIVPQRSISDKPRAPITALQFHPLKPRLNQAQVQHSFTEGANAALGGGGPGVNASLGVAVVREVQYARDEGIISFDGKRSGPSKLTWTWKAGDFVESGFEDPCEFWVTIPPVKKGVKANFKVTCLVSSGRWGYKRIMLPDDKTKPVHELELHFT